MAKTDIEARAITALVAVKMWDGDTFSHYHTREELTQAGRAVIAVVSQALATRDETRARVMNRILTDDENAIWDMARVGALKEAAEVARCAIGKSRGATSKYRDEEAADIAAAIEGLGEKGKP